MRKKYLSALLFGALLFASAGTFTSCKDYDDDINNLQSQIDKLATKEDMEAKLSQMETAINDAKATAEEALKAAQEAGSADEIAKLEARIKALEDAALDVDALKKEIADSVEEQMADFREEMEELLKKVEELTGYSLEMVTSIDLQSNENAGFDTKLDLNYSRIEKITFQDAWGNKIADDVTTSYEFGEGLTGAFTVKKGDVYTVKDHILASVAPVNATVDANMVSLINSKAASLNDYVTYTASDYTGLLTQDTRSTANGLREIGVQLKSDVDFEAFHKLVSTAPEYGEEGDGYVNYALAVTDAEKERTVTSTYDLTIKVAAEESAKGINDASKIGSNASVNEASISEYYWSNELPNYDKWDEHCYPAKLGEEFYIKVASYQNSGRVMASYVVVDYDNELLSNTDVAAIKGLTFSGVNQVSKDNFFNIKIDGEHSGIVVPLKVVSIDYTGVVEENVVWVKAGKEVVGLTAEYTATPAEYVVDAKNYQINTLDAFTVPEKAYYYTMDLTVGESNHTDKREFSITDNTQINWNGVANVLEFYKNADGTGTPTKATEVAFAKFVGAVNLNSMKEDVTYTGVIKFYDDKGTYLSTNEIKVTKKLPTAVPSYFSAKTNAINNGVLSVYPNPTSGTTLGEFDLNRAFNGLDKTSAKYFVLTSSVLKDNKLAALSYNKITAINPAIINDGKTYAAAMSYNYGKIEYQPVGVGVETVTDYYVKWNTDFAIKFGCVPVGSKYTWTGSTPVVYYKEDKTINSVTKYNEDGSAAAWGDFLTVKDPYGQTIDPFSNTKPSTDWNWGIWSPLFNNAAFDANPETGVKIELITNGDKVNEFFTAKIVNDPTTHNKYALQLTQTSTAVVLSGDVETTVVFKFKDKFGHDHAIKALTFTMKKDHNE